MPAERPEGGFTQPTHPSQGRSALPDPWLGLAPGLDEAAATEIRQNAVGFFSALLAAQEELRIGQAEKSQVAA